MYLDKLGRQDASLSFPSKERLSNEKQAPGLCVGRFALRACQDAAQAMLYLELSEAPATGTTQRSTSLLQDINAMMSGMQRGRQQALQGVIPSSMNAGGAAPAQMDPMAPKLKFIHAQLMSAIADLHRMHADPDAAKLMKAAETVLNLKIDRQKRIAKDGMETATSQANPLRLNAMGSNLNG